MSFTKNELSVLSLVASDVSYRDRSEFESDALKAPLFSFQDNFPEPETGFPLSLLTGLPTSGDSPLAYRLAESENGDPVVFFENWEFVRKFQEPSGFGAVVYRSKASIEGKAHYILALQGTDGPNRLDWYQNIDLARQAWAGVRNGVLDFLVNGASAYLGEVAPFV